MFGQQRRVGTIEEGNSVRWRAYSLCMIGALTSALGCQCAPFQGWGGWKVPAIGSPLIPGVAPHHRRICGPFGGNDCVSNYFARRQYEKMARRAYASCAGVSRHPGGDFHDGFFAGYLDVATGGCGRVPAVPPHRYWGRCYTNPGGHQDAEAWFAGFAAGAGAAQGDGVGNYYGVPSSPYAQPNYSAEPSWATTTSYHRGGY